MSLSAQPWSSRVQSILDQMTVEEKVGQMTQLTVDMICEGNPYAIKVPFEINEEKLEKVVVKYLVGSMLNVPSSHYPDASTWQSIISTIQRKSRETRLQIPVLYGLDHIHGVSYVKGGTLFPQPLAQACSWNVALNKRIGAITAYESRAVGVPWSFSPAMDIGRNPEWPRLWESYGEDVLVNTIMGKTFLEGMQGEDLSSKERIAGCLKHFTGYGMPLSGKDRTPAWIPERMLREYYLPQYQAAIDAGAITLMVNSGEINGIPTHIDKHLLTDILRDEMGFKGLVVTDWADIRYLYERHKVAGSLKEAVRLAVEAGIDMSMTPVTFDFADLLIELVKEGTVAESRLDLSVGRILTVKEKLGLFEKTHHKFADYPDFGSAAHQGISLQSATESIVLLKNEDGILPLSKNKKVLVTGPTANTQRSLNGGWTANWQGETVETELDEFPTILGGIQQIIGNDNVTYVAGADFDMLSSVDQAKSAADSVDYIILCVGELSYTEDAGNLNDLNLPRAQYRLAEELSKSNKPIILIMAGGRPRIIRTMVSQSQGVIAAFYPGPQGGQALAKILYGDANPSGKLAITYPQYANSLVPYDHKYTEDRDVMNSGLSFNPQFHFGHGLSYTEFEYENLEIEDAELSSYGSLDFSVDVTNIGSRPGMEVIHVFVSDLVASITPPVKRLRAFEKIHLQPGTSQRVSFSIPIRDLAFVGHQNKWIVEPGQFELMVGDLKASFEVK